MAVHNDIAYLFTGSTTVSTFDLNHETWGSMPTSIKAGQRWPWRANKLSKYAMEIHNGRIYIFGGDDNSGEIGRNILMCMDLKNHEWRIISGTTTFTGGSDCPNPRKWAASWMVDELMYVTLGSADRSDARTMGKEHGGSKAHAYQDLWSFDTSTEVWRQEKMNGNTPLRRSEFGYCFNKQWNSGVVFGGYTESLPLSEGDTLLEYSYFADTFIWSAETSRWSQVITRGFPTYRASVGLFLMMEKPICLVDVRRLSVSNA